MNQDTDLQAQSISAGLTKLQELLEKTGRHGALELGNPLERIGGTLTGSGLDLETKIFSASGRGETFFLTSLFIELNENSLYPESTFRYLFSMSTRNPLATSRHTQIRLDRPRTCPTLCTAPLWASLLSIKPTTC
jgi:hypothetical protein